MRAMGRQDDNRQRKDKLFNSSLRSVSKCFDESRVGGMTGSRWDGQSSLKPHQEDLAMSVLNN